MKLLVVSQYFWPEDFRINELVAALVERGHEVSVLTSIPNYPEGSVFADYEADPASYMHYAGAEIIRVPQMVRGKGKLRLVANYLSFAASACLLGAWKLRHHRFDAVFVFQTSPVTVGIPGGMLARLNSAPMLMWILDCWPETLKAIGVGSGRAAQAAVGLMVRGIYASADLLLGQSRGFEENVARYSQRQKFRYFPNWVENVYLDSPPPPAAPYDGRFVLLYAGNIGEAQDLTTVVEAVARLDRPDLLVRIVGDGRDLPRVMQRIAELQAARSFEFAGRHPATAMPGFFAGADALLVSLKPDPLFAMTVPGKVQTYLASGRPILAMLDGEGAEVVRDSGAGLVVPAGDSKGLADAVRALMDMPAAERAHFADSGLRYAMRHYRLASLLDRLEGWLAEVTTTLHPPPRLAGATKDRAQ